MRSDALRNGLMAALLCAMVGAMAPARAGTGHLPGGLSWGDDVAEIQGRIGKVQPDLCSGDEASYYRSMGWSCEGMSKPGFSAGGAAFNVRLRMAEMGYGLANINMVAKVAGKKASPQLRQALASVCGATLRLLVSRFGEGIATSDVSQADAFRRVHTWTTPDRRSEVTLACVESQGADGGGEVMVDFEPVRGRPGLV